MSHYFEYDPNLKEKIREVSYKINDTNFKLYSDINTFSNKRLDKGTNILINTLIKYPLNGSFLDLGCGYGPVGITLKLLYKDLMVTMSDVNKRCIELTNMNLKKYDLFDTKTIISDSYSNIENCYDYVAFNPPISCGKEKIFQMYSETYKHLNHNGQFFIVIRKDKGAMSHLKYLSSLFSKISIICKEKGYFVFLAIKEN